MSKNSDFLFESFKMCDQKKNIFYHKGNRKRNISVIPIKVLTDIKYKSHRTSQKAQKEQFLNIESHRMSQKQRNKNLLLGTLKRIYFSKIKN